MLAIIYILAGITLLIAAYIVFRRIVRKDYEQKGGLTWLSSTLQLLIFIALMCFPYIYNPPGWEWFWMLDGKGTTNKIIGLVFILFGFLFAFGTMFWFGVRRAFGLESNRLIQSGPYRFSRNPQVLGGYLLVFGVALQWLSWHAIGWVVLYGAIVHMMIITEEEYLREKYGDEYIRYCGEVSRYLLKV